MKDEWVSFTPRSIDPRKARWREMIILVEALVVGELGVFPVLLFNGGKERSCVSMYGVREPVRSELYGLGVPFLKMSVLHGGLSRHEKGGF